MGKIKGLTDKPVKIISQSNIYYRNRSKDSIKREDVICDFGHNIFLKSYTDLEKEVQALQSPLKIKDVLYFHTSSKFPRFKLQDSGFKRCIKEDKADVIVFGQHYLSEIKDNKRTDSTVYTIYEEANNYLIACDEGYYTPNVLPIFKVNTVQEMVENHYLEKGAQKIYEGPIINVNNDVAETYDNIFKHLYPNIIFDKELDAIISANLEPLTDESLGSIREMLESEDMAVVDMGLKLLPNYNVTDKKLSVGTILAMNHTKCSASKVWNSTSVKQLKESINYREPYSSGVPGCFFQLVKEDETYSEDDVTLTKKVILDAVSGQIDAALSRLNKTASYYNLDININAQ